MRREETINLNNLTQKELLILLNEKVENLESDIKMKSQIDLDLQLRVNTLETKFKQWAFMGAAVVTILFKIAEKILQTT